MGSCGSSIVVKEPIPTPVAVVVVPKEPPKPKQTLKPKAKPKVKPNPPKLVGKSAVLCFNRNQINVSDLLQVTNALTVVDDPTEVETLIQQSECEKISVVFTESPDEDFLRRVENSSKVEAVYTLNSKGKETQHSFSTMSALCEKLKIDLKPPEDNLLGFDLLDRLTTTSMNRQNKQETSFMYTQLFNEMILQTTDDTLTSMLEFWRGRKRDDEKAIIFLKEFEGSYRPEGAIWWYTRESFLFKELNTALRQHDYEVIYECRVFIRHLHEQILSEYQQHKTSIITVYRGMIIDDREVQNIREKVGGLMSQSSFLSTTSNTDVADKFARDERQVPQGKSSVLMEITVDEKSLFPVADINHLSYFKDEDEWLFSMGVVFRIDSVEQSPNKIWIVKLRTTSDSDEILMKLKQHYKDTLKDKNTILNIARLLYELEKYDQAKRFYLQGLKSETHWKRQAQININLGSVEQRLHNLDEALRCYKKALDLELKHGGENSPGLSAMYNNIASVYYQQKQTALACEHFLKAEEAYHRSEKKNNEYIAGIYHNIATILNDGGKHDEALLYYQKCLKIQDEHYQGAHPNIAATFRGIANTYRFRKSFAQAETHAEKALEMARSTLPENHRDLRDHEACLQSIRREMNS